jgi:hypothetical protein
MSESTFTPKPPTRQQALDIKWCHLLDGIIHAAGWDDGLTTLVEDGDGNTVCYGQTFPAPLATLHPWRDRRLLGRPVCGYCEQDVDHEEALTELVRR